MVRFMYAFHDQVTCVKVSDEKHQIKTTKLSAQPPLHSHDIDHAHKKTNAFLLCSHGSNHVTQEV